MVKEAGEHLKRNAIAWWRIGIDEIVKWSEWKEEGLSKQYVIEAAKASNEAHMNIGTLEPVMHRRRRLQIGGCCSEADSLFRFELFNNRSLATRTKPIPPFCWLHCGVAFPPICFLSVLGTVLAKLNAVSTLFGRSKDERARVCCIWGEAVVCFCMLCLWGDELCGKLLSSPWVAFAWRILCFRVFWVHITVLRNLLNSLWA